LIGPSERAAQVDARDQIEAEETIRAEDEERRAGKGLTERGAAEGRPEEVHEIAGVAREGGELNQPDADEDLRQPI
jgi:hypothetical protein